MRLRRFEESYITGKKKLGPLTLFIQQSEFKLINRLLQIYQFALCGRSLVLAQGRKCKRFFHLRAKSSKQMNFIDLTPSRPSISHRVICQSQGANTSRGTSLLIRAATLLGSGLNPPLPRRRHRRYRRRAIKSRYSHTRRVHDKSD